MDPVVRPQNGLLLIALQTAEGTPATPNALTDAVPFVMGSFRKGSPYGSEEVNEVTGSLVASAPLIVGQEVQLGFQSMIKGAGNGVTYSSSVKPPLHAALSVCGKRGQFTAGVATTALAAGTVNTATLGAPYVATDQAYRGMPLLLTGGSGDGMVPFISDYSAARVAQLTAAAATALSTATSAALPANWSYAGTSPRDLSSRLTDHPCATVYYYEDGNLYQWTDVRGTVDLEGQTARAGMATFSLSGTYVGSSVATIPSNAVVALQSAPTLQKGASGGASVALANRKELAISRWSLRNGGNLESVQDPNTPFGFGPGQIAGRAPVFEADPYRTLVSTRDAIAEIAALNVYNGSLRFGTQAGNRWGLTMPALQPVGAEDDMRGNLRSDSMTWRALSPGRDAQLRDSDAIITFF